MKVSGDYAVSLSIVLGVSGAGEPQDHRAWTSALKAALTPEQFAAWDKLETEERQKLKAEIDARLDAWLAPGRETMERSLLAKTEEMSRTLKLPKERVEELKSLAKEALNASMAKWRARQEQWYVDMDEEQRRELLKNRRVYFSPNSAESPEKMAVWKTGLAKFFSADERKQLEAEAAEHTARLARALTRLMVAEIDERVALTAKQREQIEPICDRLATKNVGLLPSPSTPAYQQTDVIEMLASGLKSAQSELQKFLEQVQWRHWLEASESAIGERGDADTPAAAKAQKEKPALPTEAEDFERIVGSYLDEETQKARQKALGESLLWAEDAGRASNLPVEKVELLKTAARGAVEESMHNWKSNVDETLHTYVRDTPVRFVQTRLESFERYNFQQRLYPPPETQAIWTDALKANLDAEETAAAKKSASERETFKADSIAAFVVAMFLINPTTLPSCSRQR